MKKSLKNNGETHEKNLAYACAFCNRSKGSDIGSRIPDTDRFCRFFNPRMDRWSESFLIGYSYHSPRTDIGEVIARILQFNIPEPLAERQILASEGRYPTDIAQQHLKNQQTKPQ